MPEQTLTLSVHRLSPVLRRLEANGIPTDGIRYVEEENAVLLQTERRTERIPQPDPEKLSLSPYGENEEQSDVSEEDFFALDQIAMREAARIYRVLSQNGSFSPDIGRQEATA